MTSPASPPGLMKPTQIGMIGSNPQQSAILTQTNMNQKQASLGNAVGGRKKKGGAVPVPQFNMPYPVQNGPDQSPNTQIVANSQNSMQSSANRVNDNLATSMKGGFVKWGCYSGGIKRRTRRTRKTRRTRRTRRIKTRRVKKRNHKRN
jgi:hypothetical protein